MTAQEMFEQLGYHKNYEMFGEILYEHEDYETNYFVFEGNRKRVAVGSYHVTLDELKAINKQCEELGWIE